MLKCTKLCVNHLRMLPTTLLSKQVDPLAQQTRNTFVLKRKHPLPLYKKNQRPHVFKNRNYIYELVEYKNTKKDPLVTVVLIKNVEGHGKKGETITAKSITAYNKLILPQLAVYATPENIEKYKIKETDVTEEYITPQLKKMMDILSTLRLNVILSDSVPWTLEKWHIRTNFQMAGIHVPEDAILIPEKPIAGPDPSIENKEFFVTVTIDKSQQVKVRCAIQHFIPGKNDLDDEGDEDGKNAEGTAIFPEDQPIIDLLREKPTTL